VTPSVDRETDNISRRPRRLRNFATTIACSAGNRGIRERIPMLTISAISIGSGLSATTPAAR